MPDNADNAVNANKFVCEKCDFRCSKQSNYDTHLLTYKHQKITGNNQTESKPSLSFICPNCNKKYSHLSGLCRHRKICVSVKPEIKPIENIDSDSDCDTGNDSDSYSDESYSIDHTQNVIIRNNVKPRKQNTDKKIKNLTAENRQMKIEMARMLSIVANNTQFQTQLLEFMKTTQSLQVGNTMPAATPSSIGVVTNGDHNTINSNNNTFNMNMFLNEQCKDAMNIQDFADSFQLQISDLEKVGSLGYVDGISDIIIKKLNELDVYKRPIHCSDTKRDTMYVHADDVWSKETSDHDQVRMLVQRITAKNIRLLPIWREMYPNCKNNMHRLNETYLSLTRQAMGGFGGTIPENESKIIRKIAKTVFIDKNM